MSHTIEPIREWLDDRENRRGWLGSSRKHGEYYCIPVAVLRDCGLSIDEIFHGKTYLKNLKEAIEEHDL